MRHHRDPPYYYYYYPYYYYYYYNNNNNNNYYYYYYYNARPPTGPMSLSDRSSAVSVGRWRSPRNAPASAASPRPLPGSDTPARYSGTSDHRSIGRPPGGQAGGQRRASVPKHG